MSILWCIFTVHQGSQLGTDIDVVSIYICNFNCQLSHLAHTFLNYDGANLLEMSLPKLLLTNRLTCYSNRAFTKCILREKFEV